MRHTLNNDVHVQIGLFSFDDRKTGKFEMALRCALERIRGIHQLLVIYTRLLWSTPQFPHPTLNGLIPFFVPSSYSLFLPFWSSLLDSALQLLLLLYCLLSVKQLCVSNLVFDWLPCAEFEKLF